MNAVKRGECGQSREKSNKKIVHRSTKISGQAAAAFRKREQQLLRELGGQIITAGKNILFFLQKALAFFCKGVYATATLF